MHGLVFRRFGHVTLDERGMCDLYVPSLVAVLDWKPFSKRLQEVREARQ